MKEESKAVHGYKVFNPDWTCSPEEWYTKQYTCPGKFEEEGELEVCGHGMHFCEKAYDCFRYYPFDSNNKVAEVVAYGRVVKDDIKSCTDKLEIVREIPWDEVLRIVNIGNACTGVGNTGDWNTGNRNTGDSNSGDCNSGNRNTGAWNTGCFNTGNWNSGNCNTGTRNTGDYNTGRGNTGDYNTGRGNTGDYNIGNRNTGGWNTGVGNTGKWNTGDWNTGDWNAGDWNTGCFMTGEPTIYMFNRPSVWTFRDWLNSRARILLDEMIRGSFRWIADVDMTDAEKAEHPEYKTTGGYLREPEGTGYRQDWWNALPEKDKITITELPNFDPEIFEMCTGIKVEEVDA